jgi:transposase-like protein
MGTQNYSQEFKSAALQKLLSPNSKGLRATAEELGLATSTLYSWQHGRGKVVNMKNKKEKSLKDWTPEEKLDAIIKTSSMAEHELGEYLRSHGLYSVNLEQWKKDFTNGLKADLGRPKKDTEVLKLRKKEQDLEKELNRKDKALAEMTARVILLKKSHLLFGEDEDNL